VLTKDQAAVGDKLAEDGHGHMVELYLSIHAAQHQE
jgi:hypothetical protein